MWTPNGQRLIFSSQRTGAGNLYWQPADGAGPVDRLSTESPNIQMPTAVTPDGHSLIFTEAAANTGGDVMLLTLDEPRTVKPLVKTAFSERNGIVSPNGQWLAYEANDSGRFEIFVRPFPEVGSASRSVSTAGGTRPLWARNGRELFYVSPTGAVMRVGVEPGRHGWPRTPTMVVKEGYLHDTAEPRPHYDIADDGRFLMMKARGADGTAAPASLIVVQHWVEELKRLVPTK